MKNNPSTAIRHEGWWKRLKKFVRRRDKFQCVVCEAPQRIVGDLIAAHVRPRRSYPELEKEANWVVTLCRICDAKIGDDLERYLKRHPQIWKRLPKLLLNLWNN